jgi:uncharacterized protein
MPMHLFTFIAMYRRDLDTLAHLLRRGQAFAAEQGFTDASMLEWRLAEDMHPMAFQIAAVVNLAGGWSARAAAKPVPDVVVGAEHGVAGLLTAIAVARAGLDALTEADLAGRDDAPISFTIMEGMAPTLPAGQWLSGFVTTNVHFHLNVAYAILRMKGVRLGKADLFPSGL